LRERPVPHTGLTQQGPATLRAHSIASANYEELLEFLSIMHPMGRSPPAGNTYTLVSRKRSGALGLQDPCLNERFERVVFVGGAGRAGPRSCAIRYCGPLRCRRDSLIS
jgi:hypothetical protein